MLLGALSSAIRKLTTTPLLGGAGSTTNPFVALFQAATYKRTVHKQLKNTIEKGWVYAYRDRRRKTRLARQLSIMRVNTGPVRYATLKGLLDDAGIQLNVKSLERLSIGEPETIRALQQSLPLLKPKTASK